jgi:hypothetical protein
MINYFIRIHQNAVKGSEDCKRSNYFWAESWSWNKLEATLADEDDNDDDDNDDVCVLH